MGDKIEVTALKAYSNRNGNPALLEGAIDYIAHLEQQLRWIPVSERLPEVGAKFLVYDTFYEKHEAIECVRMGRMTDSWGIAPEGMNGKCPTITHWKPITPPGEE